MSLNTILATAPLATTGFHIKATGTTLGNSLIWDNGTNVGIGNTNTSYTLDVSGTGRYTTSLLVNDISISSSTMQASGNYYIGCNNANFIQFYTSNTDRMAITAAGNVGIGTTSPDTLLTVNGTSGTKSFALVNSGGGTRADFTITENDGLYINSNEGATARNIILQTGGTERMRITSSGEVLMHSTTFNSANDGQLFGTGGDTYFTVAGATVLYLNRRTTNGVIIDFRFNNTSVGSISTNSNSLPSDRNFKKNITDISIGLDLVTKLKPVHYRHKFDEDNEPLSNGIIAQELEEALLECGIEKNSLLMLQYKPNEKEGESQYWVDYTKMIPVLVKAIQEMNTKLDEQNQTIQNLQEQINILAK